MNKIIHCKVKLKCDTKYAFEMFTKNELISTWLCKYADIEPVINGKYELFWDDNKEINSTIGCKITAIEPSRLLCFEWKGSLEFSEFMNYSDPLTHVCVLFSQENNDSCEVNLIHSGWKDGENWETARKWFENCWNNLLNVLQKKIEKKEWLL